jgi:hypothetical protein
MRNQGRLGTFRINETARLSTQSPGAWFKFAKAIAMNKEPGIGKSIGRLGCWVAAQSAGRSNEAECPLSSELWHVLPGIAPATAAR